MQSRSTWEYTVQLMDGVRLYRQRPLPGEHPLPDVRNGLVWELHRNITTADDKPYRQTLVASAEVFESTEDAKRDALEKLSMLRCPFDKPIDTAIKWILDNG